MWIMTSYGILMPAALPTQFRPRKHPEWDMQIRSRDRETLTKLRKRLVDDGASISRIRDTRDKDYEWRFYLNRWTFAAFMQEEIAAIDYDKFKPTTENPGGGGPELHELYTLLWFRIAEHYDSPILGRYEERRKARRK